jgi:hypothetical protein
MIPFWNNGALSARTNCEFVYDKEGRMTIDGIQELRRPPRVPWTFHESRDYQITRDDLAQFSRQAIPAARSFNKWIVHNRDFLIRGQTLLEICEAGQSEGPRPPLSFRGRMHLPERLVETTGLSVESGNKVLATLESGHLGLVPADAEKGDSIWVLQGCSVPLALRKRPGVNVYTLVGEAYVHTFMSGEAFEGGYEVEEVVIG